MTYKIKRRTHDAGGGGKSGGAGNDESDCPVPYWNELDV